MNKLLTMSSVEKDTGLIVVAAAGASAGSGLGLTLLLLLLLLLVTGCCVLLAIVGIGVLGSKS